LLHQELVSSVNAYKKGSLAQGTESLDENHREAITLKIKSPG
jgi:hypothetical protein